MSFNKKSKGFSEWEQSAKMLGTCTVCGRAYGSGKMKILKNEKKSRLLHATCAFCNSHFMAMLMKMGGGMSTIGMVTDLSLNDSRRLLDKAPITVNEAIEGYKYINEKFSQAK
ncbi:hypothetical protein EPN28_02835 [Patescibacteria group bacterium]|nr:MAG: hypothetical protein EPN28_02835 [Patescibacteria group bacterium]